jgi:hypothetical protein
MDKRSIKGMLVASIVMMSTGFASFTRMTGSENIRPVAIVTLLACGAGIGIFLVSIVRLIKSGKDQ